MPDCTQDLLPSEIPYLWEAGRLKLHLAAPPPSRLADADAAEADSACDQQSRLVEGLAGSRGADRKMLDSSAAGGSHQGGAAAPAAAESMAERKEDEAAAGGGAGEGRQGREPSRPSLAAAMQELGFDAFLTAGAPVGRSAQKRPREGTGAAIRRAGGEGQDQGDKSPSTPQSGGRKEALGGDLFMEALGFGASDSSLRYEDMEVKNFVVDSLRGSTQEGGDVQSSFVHIQTSEHDRHKSQEGSQLKKSSSKRMVPGKKGALVEGLVSPKKKVNIGKKSLSSSSKGLADKDSSLDIFKSLLNG